MKLLLWSMRSPGNRLSFFQRFSELITPMTKKRAVLVGASLSLFALAYIFRRENISTTVLWNLSRGGTWLLPLGVFAV